MRSLGFFVVVSMALAGQVQLAAPPVKIWDHGAHNAFTDLLRVGKDWYCVFREGAGHAAGAGKIRVLRSGDTRTWESCALLELPDVDLRDPHVSVMPDGRLMINGGAAVPATRDPVRDHYSFVSFSKDGQHWTQAERVLDSWQWLWRVTWHKETAYGVAYGWDPAAKPARIYHAALYKSHDGKNYERITKFDLPQATEATIRFDGDVMYCLQRRDGKPNNAMLGRSEPPYTSWMWKDLGTSFGGPNFIKSAAGVWWAVGRVPVGGKQKTALCRLDLETARLDRVLTLPSGGDTSYAGLVWDASELVISYYSSHETKTGIYLARAK